MLAPLFFLFPPWASLPKQLLRGGLVVTGVGGWAPASQAQTFAPVATYAAGLDRNSLPRQVAVADVNADGRPDLLVANSNYFGSVVGVLLGKGNGAFQPVATYGTGGSSPTSIAAADLNADGQVDLVTTNAQSQSIGVLLGNGTGTFRTATAFPTGSITYPTSAVVADVNGDGRPDVLVGSDGSTGGVLLGNGDGTFRLGATYTLGGAARPQYVLAGDVNADGRPDLLAASSTTSTVSVLLGNGNGTFRQPVDYATGPGSTPTSAALADVNADGRLDLLTANYGANAAGVLLGAGGGAFQPVAAYSTGPGTQPYGLAVADITGDGRPDVVTTNYTASTATVLPGNGDGTFQPPVSYSTGTGGTPYGVAVADVNGDGKPDVLAANASDGTVGVLVNTTPLDLVVSTTAVIAPGSYNSLTVTGSGQATLGGNVTVNSFAVVQRGGSLAGNGFVLGGSGSFAVADGATLISSSPQGLSLRSATGDIQVTGTRTYAAGAKYGYRSSSAQRTGDGLPSQVAGLGVLGSADLTLAQDVAVTEFVVLNTPANLRLNGRTLTLRSDAAYTAMVYRAVVPGQATGKVLGNTAAVQRYLDGSLNAGPGYRQLSSPVANATVADLRTASFAPVVNAAYNTSLTPAATTPYPTVYGYDEARLRTATGLAPFDKGWYSPAAATDPLAVGQGYTVHVAGNETLVFQGTLTSDDQLLTLARTDQSEAGGWHLVGNPFPGPLDLNWAAADRPGLEAAVYISQSLGPYAGQYRSYVNGVGLGLAPLGQAFFVRVSQGQAQGTLRLRASQQAVPGLVDVPVQRLMADTRPLLRLTLNAAGDSRLDELSFYAQEGATPGFDPAYDASKFPAGTGLQVATLTGGGQALSIQGLPTLAGRQALAVQVPAPGTYYLTLAELRNLPPGTRPELEDVQTGQRSALDTPGSFYSFRTTANEVLAGRFWLHLRTSATPLPVATGALAASISLYPNPAHAATTLLVPPGTAAGKVEVVDLLGRWRQTRSLPAGGGALHLALAGLPAGTYLVRVQTDQGLTTRRLVLE